MVEQHEVAENEAGSGEIRSKLITRLAVAGVLVALLLGVLAFFDYLSTAPDDSDEQVFTKPVPVAPKKEVTQPVTPAENLPEPPLPSSPEKTAAGGVGKSAKIPVDRSKPKASSSASASGACPPVPTGSRSAGRSIPHFTGGARACSGRVARC